MIGGECQDPHLLMLCRLLYDTITDSHCTWIAVLWPLVWYCRLMWPLAECISSTPAQTPSLQLGVLQSLQGSFHLSPDLLFYLALLYLWWKPGSCSTSLSTSIEWPKSGIREWTPLHPSPFIPHNFELSSIQCRSALGTSLHVYKTHIWIMKSRQSSPPLPWTLLFVPHEQQECFRAGCSNDTQMSSISTLPPSFSFKIKLLLFFTLY
jgi:hypothetical protein